VTRRPPAVPHRLNITAAIRASAPTARSWSESATSSGIKSLRILQNAGKIFLIHPNGQLEQFARGFRNPFGVVWEAANQRVISTDNGDVGNDEINIVHAGDFCGWPYTEGTKPPVAGAVPPVYTFPMTVAPTGMLALSGRNAILLRGYLICSFVTKTIYWVQDIDARPFPDPIPLVNNVSDGIIDVAEAPDGEILFVTGNAIYKLFPIRLRAVRTEPGVRKAGARRRAAGGNR